MRQSQKVLWVVLSSLYFKKISNNGTSGQGRNLRVLKESNKKWIWQLQCQEQCIDHIPYYFLGLSCANFLWTTFLEIAVYGINIKVWTWATLVAARRVLSPLLHRCSPKMVLTVTLLFQLQSSYEVWTTIHLVLLVCLVPLVPPIHPICLMSLFIWWIFNNDRLKPPCSSCWLGIVKWW